MTLSFSSLSDTRKAVLLALMGYLCFSFADVTSKLLTEHYSVFHVTTNNGMSAILLLLIMKAWQKQKLDLIRPQFHFLRGLANFIIAVLIVYSFTIMPIADAYTMIFSAPFWGVLIASIVYKEQLTRNRIIALLAGFIGVVIALRPAAIFEGQFNLELLFPLSSAALIAFMFVSTRSMTKSSALSLGFFPLLMSGVLSVPLLIANYTPVAAEHVPLFIANALLVAIALPCLSVAYSIGKTALIAPIQYSEMVIAVVLGFLIFGDIPTPYMMAGAGIIIAGGVYLALSERRASLKRTQ